MKSRRRKVVRKQEAQLILGDHYSDFIEWTCGLNRPSGGYYRAQIDAFLAGEKPPSDILPSCL